jgi:hypothetical protein
MKICKYRLNVIDKQEFLVPKGTQFLSVGVQDGIVTTWALVSDTTKEQQKVTFYIIGTGNPIPDDYKLMAKANFLGTIQQGIFVWHVFMEV